MAVEAVNYIEANFAGMIVCRGYRRTWSFPVEVSDLLKAETAGMSVLHLFGGMASFGTRIDCDATVRPDVVGNGLFPPFGCDSFDAVIVDPPYLSAYQMPISCLWPAACCARSRVWWFHTHFQPHVHGLKPLRWWGVLPSRKGPLRILIEYERTRHPGRCTVPPGWKFGSAMNKFNWSRDLVQRSLSLSHSG